jgi:hypothetical protein
MITFAWYLPFTCLMAANSYLSISDGESVWSKSLKKTQTPTLWCRGLRVWFKLSHAYCGVCTYVLKLLPLLTSKKPGRDGNCEYHTTCPSSNNTLPP